MANNAGAEQQGEDEQQQQYQFKVLLVGESGSGKTSIVQRYINGTFSSKFKLTIGVDFMLKQLKWDEHTTMRLQFWDIAGQERFGHMTPLYYREAVGAFVVFDVTSPITFEMVPKWKQDLDEHLNTNPALPPLPVILLANKSDLADAPPNKEVMDRYCVENGFTTWFFTSAKDDKNISEAVRCLVAAILEKEKPTSLSQAKPKDTIVVSSAKSSPDHPPCPC